MPLMFSCTGLFILPHKMPYLNKSLFALFCAAIFTLTSCKTSTTPDTPGGSTMSGTLVYDMGSSDPQIGLYSFSTQRETIAFTKGLSPSWTPSGEVLYEEPDLFVPNYYWAIALSASNGTNKRIVLGSTIHNNYALKSPKMSKDGSTICFSYWYRGGGVPPELTDRHATILMSSSGTLLGEIDSLFDGSWMPDGSLVLSCTLDESAGETTFYGGGLYLLSADNTKITAIGSGLVNPKHPAASPDGKKIAFSMSAHIWVINSDGTGLRQVTTGDKLETHPCWSPDGKYIACMSAGMFEVKSATVIAALPVTNATAIDLNNDSQYWVRDPSQSSNYEYGRITTYSSISWK